VNSFNEVLFFTIGMTQRTAQIPLPAIVNKEVQLWTPRSKFGPRGLWQKFFRKHRWVWVSHD
jgi:hypothetical protein